MDQPVAPTLANIFLCIHENKWLDECPLNFKPTLYRRYMDDTFLLFQEHRQIDLFLDYLNKKHPNIKFTKEVENNNSINFLDIKILKNNNKFETSVYRKPTFTGLTMNFNSFAPFQYKINLIKTLIYRAYHISSSFINFHVEIEKITNILCNNGFKNSIIFKEIKKILLKIYSNNTSTNNNKPDKLIIFFKIPFQGKESFIIRKRLNILLSRYYPQVKLNFVFTTNYKINNFFRFKDKVPDAMRSSLVYKYTCDRCNSVYIGKTSRHLSTRVSEHIGVSYRTKRALTSPPFSSIREHIASSGHKNYSITPNQFHIITSAQNDLELVIKESLYIKKLRPSLNDMEAAKLRVS